jgi:anti-sigma factor RsiW
MTVTRDVVSDLWPLYASGEASADTRALVEVFLATDPAFAQVLRESANVTLPAGSAPVLPPDHELVALHLTRRRLWGPGWLFQMAMLFSFFAFGRIISDTSFDVSPRNFIATAAVAACFWTAFFVILWRNRARILLVRPKASPPARP